MKPVTIIGVVVGSIFAMSLFFSPVQADINLGGDLEIDTSYASTSEDTTTATTQDIIEYDLSGRIKIVPSVKTEAGNLFMEAVAEILAKTDGTAEIDDAWGKIGTSIFDVQIGRYEAWTLFDESNDMLIVDAPNGAGRYKADNARGRMDSAGQVALHVLPSDALGLEMGFVYGNDGDDNVIGFRPVVNSTFGPVEVAVGVDMLNTTPKDDSVQNSDTSKLGVGARVKAVFGMATLGINYASGTEENDATPNADKTTNSMGGYCDLTLGNDAVLTLGAILTHYEEDNSSYENEHSQYYIAYAHPLPIDGAAVQFALSQAAATQEAAGGDLDSDALGFKIRLNYSF
jgi:hypothetical protein